MFVFLDKAFVFLDSRVMGKRERGRSRVLPRSSAVRVASLDLVVTAVDELRELTEAQRDLDSERTRLVASALREGATWADIGDATGVTRQAAYERHRRSQR